MSETQRFALFLLLAIARTAIGEEPQFAPPHTVVRHDAQGVTLRPDVIRRMGSGLFRHDSWMSGSQIISATSKSITICNSHSLRTFDVSGVVRYEFSSGGGNLTAKNLGDEGIQVDFHGGPAAGTLVVLEQETGRILRRGKRAPPATSDPHTQLFAGGRRGVVYREKPQRTSIPMPYFERLATLQDMANNRALLDLGELAPGPGLDGLNPAEDRLALTAGGQLRIIDTEAGKLLHQLELGMHISWSNPAIWDTAGKLVYVWRRHDDKHSQLLEVDAVSGKSRTVIDQWKYFNTHVYPSPDGKLLAYYRHPRNIPGKKPGWVILNLSDLTEAAFVDWPGDYPQAAFASDMKSLWLVDECGLARFDLTTKQIVMPRADPLVSVTALSFSPDSEKLFGTAAHELLTWDVGSGQEIAPRQQFAAAFPEAARVRCAQIDPTGELTLWRGDSHVYLLNKGQELSNFYAANCWPHKEYVVSDDLREIIHDAYYGEINHGDLRTGKTIKELLPKVRPRLHHLFTISPDKRTMAIAHQNLSSLSSQQMNIELWDLKTGKVQGKVSQMGDLHMQMHFSGDSQELRVWHALQLTRWDVTTRQKIAEKKVTEVPNPYWSWSPDRKYFLADEYRKLLLVESATGEIAQSWDCYEWRGTATAFSPDGKLLAVATPEGPVVLVELKAR